MERVKAFLLAVMVFLVMFSALPLSSADYTVHHASFPPDLPGDINNDGFVNCKDFTIISKAYPSVFGGANWDARADVNDDGVVNETDIKEGYICQSKYEVSVTPIAYTTSFEFIVPNDGDKRVWYYVLVRIYVPKGLSDRDFYLAGANVNDAVGNVKVDNKLVYSLQVGGTFNIQLGTLSSGYHLLELQYLEHTSGGKLNFTVKTADGETAWLDRFRIYVPNYGDAEVKYTVKT